jgi:hypothetical protein
MQTIDEPVDSKEPENKGLEIDGNNGVGECKIMKWYLARQDSPTTVKNRGVVLRHITNPAVIETIEYADQ